MSLFSDVVDEVYTLTNRQDLVAETSLAVKQATLDAHRSDKYPKDRKEEQVVITPAQSNIQLDTSSILTRFRQIAAMRPYDALTGSLSKIVLGPNQELAPDAILDEYAQEHLNVWYQAGLNINIRLEAAFDGLFIIYYQNPILSPDDQYNSWIAAGEFRSVIVIDAARRVFGMIGYEEAAARLNTILFGSSQASWKSNPLGGAAGLFKESCLEAGGR